MILLRFSSSQFRRSRDCLAHIEAQLRASETPHDGLVCLFAVRSEGDREVDCDEVAWEIEKVVLYHCVASRSQRLLNQEGVMARQGMDPISRKVLDTHIYFAVRQSPGV